MYAPFPKSPPLAAALSLFRSDALRIATTRHRHGVIKYSSDSMIFEKSLTKILRSGTWSSARFWEWRPREEIISKWSLTNKQNKTIQTSIGVYTAEKRPFKVWNRETGRMCVLGADFWVEIFKLWFQFGRGPKYQNIADRNIKIWFDLKYQNIGCIDADFCVQGGIF